MSSDDLVKIITALVALIAAISSAYAAVQAKQARTNSEIVSSQVHDVHVSLNSRLTQLLQTTADASRAEGVKSVTDILPQSGVPPP